MDIQLIFPDKSDYICIDYVPQIGEIITHYELGEGIVRKIHTSIIIDDSDKDPKDYRNIDKIKYVTKIYLSKI